MTNGRRIDKIHQDAIIIDGILYGPAADSDDYFHQVKEAGITATNLTVPAITDDFIESCEKIKHWQDRVERNPDVLTLALSVFDIEQAKKGGKTAIIMGTQNAVHLDEDVKNAGRLHALGVRIMQLTYQRRNSFGAGCGARIDSGLTGDGKKLVERLNELGVLVDLSHCGHETSMEAIKLSRKPCAFTHANSRVLCEHPRNKTDREIKALAAKGGVIGVVNYAPFIENRDNGGFHTIEEYLDVMEYLVKLVGADHVGLGLDFTPTWTEEDYKEAQAMYPEIYLDYAKDEIPLQGFEDISKVIKITRGLHTRGYSEEDINKMLGGNFLRLFKEVWGE
jgi:membrane dipeptidase